MYIQVLATFKAKIYHNIITTIVVYRIMCIVTTNTKYISIHCIELYRQIKGTKYTYFVFHEVQQQGCCMESQTQLCIVVNLLLFNSTTHLKFQKLHFCIAELQYSHRQSRTCSSIVYVVSTYSSQLYTYMHVMCGWIKELS